MNKENNEQPVYKYNGLLWTKTFDKMPWQETIEFCQNLNYGDYNDWRLAKRLELESLLNLEKYDPATGLPDTLSSSYWSSTTYAGYTDNVWGVNFYNGSIYDYNKYSSLYVRAVRGGQKKERLSDEEIEKIAKPFLIACGDHFVFQNAIPERYIYDFALSIENFVLGKLTK